MNKKTLILIGIIVISFGFVFSLTDYLEKTNPKLSESYEDEDLSLQGEKLKGYALGAEGLIADWYWMRSLQYIGNKLVRSDIRSMNLDNMTSLNPRLLYPLLGNATSLDPKFLAAYSYGAMVLPAIDKNQAISLIRKGIKENPDQWRLYQHLGYIYWKLEDYKMAAETYETGSKIQGAPIFMTSMAAKMTNEGGERETAREIYTQMYNGAQDSKTKESARIRLLELDSLDDRDAINEVLTEFQNNTGKCPNNLKQILQLLLKVKLPNGRDFPLDKDGNLIDPTDAPYRIDPKACTTILDFETTKIPLQ